MKTQNLQYFGTFCTEMQIVAKFCICNSKVVRWAVYFFGPLAQFAQIGKVGSQYQKDRKRIQNRRALKNYKEKLRRGTKNEQDVGVRL